MAAVEPFLADSTEPLQVAGLRPGYAYEARDANGHSGQSQSAFRHDPPSPAYYISGFKAINTGLSAFCSDQDANAEVQTSASLRKLGSMQGTGDLCLVMWLPFGGQLRDSHEVLAKSGDATCRI